MSLYYDEEVSGYLEAETVDTSVRIVLRGETLDADVCEVGTILRRHLCAENRPNGALKGLRRDISRLVWAISHDRVDLMVTLQARLGVSILFPTNLGEYV